MLERDEALQLLEACPVGAVVFDGERIGWVNAALTRLLDTAAEALIGRARNDLAPAWLQALFDRPAELRVPAAGERAERLLAGCRGSLQGREFVFYRDVSTERALLHEQERLRALLADHVPRDPLTGLLNSRGLFKDLEPQVSRSRRYHNPLSVVLLRLPQVDPRHPHGRELLVGTAQLLRDQMRWADTIGRLDDTAEFMLILPETPEAAAAALVGKLQAQLADLYTDGTAGSHRAARAEFGWAGWRKGDDPRLLVRRARERLNTNTQD